MQIPFAQWILNKNISKSAEQLFFEAFTCYKASAYRAALLFSYLGFQTILKDRILTAKKPDIIPLKLWQDSQKSLLDDDKWESTLIELVKRKQPGQVFVISDDVIRQYEYWKDRRNDCAHAKGNIISLAHVEAFWNFIESNFLRFSVNGGKEAILEKIENHFDRSLTPRDSDYSEIIKEIPHAVETKDYDEFLQELYKIFDNKGLSYDETLIPFWISLLDDCSEIRTNLIKFLMKKTNLALNIFEYDPKQVLYFASEPQFIRLLWKKLFYSHYKHYNIFISLLRHKLIPEEQFKEAVERVTNVLPTSIFSDPLDVDVVTLQDSGFFKEFADLAFGKPRKINNFDWARENKHLIVYYLKKFGLDETIVNALNNTFNSLYIPWKLGESLKELFNEVPKLKDTYIEISIKLEQEPPEELGFK